MSVSSVLDSKILVSENPRKSISVRDASISEISKACKILFDNRMLVELGEVGYCIREKLNTFDKNDEKNKEIRSKYRDAFDKVVEYQEELQEKLKYEELPLLEKIDRFAHKIFDPIVRYTNFLNIDFENGDFPAPIIYVKDNGLFAPPTYY